MQDESFLYQLQMIFIKGVEKYMQIKYFAWLLVILLSSCNKGPNLAQVCQDNPEICAKITEDNHCRRERNNTILTDVTLKQTHADSQKYQLLIAYEKYKACMGLASQIEHIKLKEKKTNRVQNYLRVQALISNLADQTKNSENPLLLYYHWTRFLDNDALAKFLKLEGTKALENPESQLHLATYYAKKDPNKTIKLLFHALELYQPDAHINPEIFHTLTTIYADKQQYKQAYIWLMILKLYAPDDPALKDKTIENYIDRKQLDIKFLNKVAKATLTKIANGKFKAPLS